MLSRLFIAAALWSPEGKRLTSWLLFVMFIVILLLSQQVYIINIRGYIYASIQVWYLIVSIPDPCCLSKLPLVANVFNSTEYDHIYFFI